MLKFKKQNYVLIKPRLTMSMQASRYPNHRPAAPSSIQDFKKEIVYFHHYCINNFVISKRFEIFLYIAAK